MKVRVDTRQRWGFGLTGAVLLGVALLTGCVPDEDRYVGPPEVGRAAPSFSGILLSGDTLNSRSLEGKPVLLNLWATWCGPCRAETPFLQEVHERYGPAGLQVVGLSMDGAGSAEQVRQFSEEYGVTYFIAHDPDMEAMDAFQVIGLPATFLVDRDGKVRLIRMGPVSESDQEFMEAIEAAL